MKRFVAALLAVVVLGSAAPQAFAIKQFNEQFKKLYAGDDASDAFKELVKDAKCNVCHINRESKKKRNVYGKALHEALEKAEFPLKEEGKLAALVASAPKHACISRRFADCIRFVHGFLILGLGVTVVDNTATCLNIELFIFQYGSA